MGEHRRQVSATLLLYVPWLMQGLTSGSIGYNTQQKGRFSAVNRNESKRVSLNVNENLCSIVTVPVNRYE